MNSILNQIVEQTKNDLGKKKGRITSRDLESFECYEKERRGFRNSLSNKNALSIIAEIKKASPSKGIIRSDFDPVKIAESYISGGASALSILTDKPFFEGSLSHLEDISIRFDIPLLRKDFIVDPYQVKEARAFGADAVLLIVSITNGMQLSELIHASAEYSLDTLVECYSEEEVDTIDWDDVKLFGVNNRDLNTFNVDLHRGVELLRKSPDETVRVSESGLSAVKDLKFLVDNGIDAALIGEYFMRQPDPGRALQEMIEQLNSEIKTESKGKGEEAGTDAC